MPNFNTFILLFGLNPDNYSNDLLKLSKLIKDGLSI